MPGNILICNKPLSGRYFAMRPTLALGAPQENQKTFITVESSPNSNIKKILIIYFRCHPTRCPLPNGCIGDLHCGNNLVVSQESQHYQCLHCVVNDFRRLERSLHPELQAALKRPDCMSSSVKHCFWNRINKSMM